MNDPLIPAGCDRCPNRSPSEREKRAGKLVAYGFGIVLTGVFVLVSVEKTPSGVQAKDPPPVGAWLVLIPSITAALGIQLDPELLGKLLNR